MKWILICSLLSMVGCKLFDREGKIQTNGPGIDPRAVTHLEKIASNDHYNALIRHYLGKRYIKFAFVNPFLDPGTFSQMLRNRIFYQNTKKYDSHADFLTSNIPEYRSLENYADLILDPLPGRQSLRQISAGVLYESTKGEKSLGFMSIFRLTEQQGRANINPKEIKQVYARLKQTISSDITSSMGLKYIFFSQENFARYREVLENDGIESVFAGDFFEESIAPTTYHDAQSYGYLKKLNFDEFERGLYGPRDIVLLDSVPLDLAPVSGVITKKSQSPHSHVIIRTKNLDVPNIFIPDADNESSIAENLGKLIQFTTLPSGEYLIKNATKIPDIDEKAKASWKARMKLGITLNPDLTVRTFLSFTDPTTVIPTNSTNIYGAKGTNFAVAHKALVNEGLGSRENFVGSFLAPLSFNRRFMDEAVVSSNICVKVEAKCNKNNENNSCSLARTICERFNNRSLWDLFSVGYSHHFPEMVTNAALRKAMIYSMQRVIKKHPVPSALLSDVRRAIERIPGALVDRRIRLRSSTNAEDIIGMNGAGLYESKSACLPDDQHISGQRSACITDFEENRLLEKIRRLEALSEPSHDQRNFLENLRDKLTKAYTLENAISNVYASLWTERAFLTREFYQINHFQVYMGLLVHPSFVDEKANGVGIVEAPFDTRDDGLSINLVSQFDDYSITNPIEQNIRPEMIRLKYKSGVIDEESHSYSTLRSRQRVLNSQAIVDLAGQISTSIEAIRVHNNVLQKVKKFDVEYKLDRRGNVLFKQIRPLSKPEDDSQAMVLDEILSQIEHPSCRIFSGTLPAALDVFRKDKTLVILFHCPSNFGTPGAWKHYYLDYVVFYSSDERMPDNLQNRLIEYRDQEFDEHVDIKTTHHNSCDGFLLKLADDSTRVAGAWGPRGSATDTCDSEITGAPSQPAVGGKSMNVYFR